jgi:hypothetical protein
MVNRRRIEASRRLDDYHVQPRRRRDWLNLFAPAAANGRFPDEEKRHVAADLGSDFRKSARGIVDFPRRIGEYERCRRVAAAPAKSGLSRNALGQGEPPPRVDPSRPTQSKRRTMD